MRMHFTDANIARLEADPDPAKRLTVWDEREPGFGVTVTLPGRRGGGKKSFIYQYRVKVPDPKASREGDENPPLVSKTRRYLLGHHGAMSVDQARRAYRVQRGQVAQGRDPYDEKQQLNEERRKALRAQHLEDSRSTRLNFRLLGEEFIEKHWREEQVTSRRRSQQGLDLLADRFEKRTIEELDRDLIRLAYVALLKVSKGTAISAHKFLSGLFRYAVTEKLIHPDLNPMTGLAPPARDLVRERTLSVDELREVWDAAGVIGYPFGSWVRSLIITMQRRTECAGAEWPEMHDEQELWIIPKERMKREKNDPRGDHVVPISAIMRTFLDGLPRVSPPTANGGPEQKKPKARFLFTSYGKGAIKAYSDTKEKLDAEIERRRRERIESAGEEWDEATSPMKPWRFHDLRRTVSTMLQALGQSEKIIDLLQDHKPSGPSKVSRHYQLYEYLEEKSDVMAVWSEFLTQLTADCAREEEAEKKPLVAKVRRRHVPRY